MARTICLQVSVDVLRWPDSMLDGMLRADGRLLSAAEARVELRAMKDRGMEVVPCGLHDCDPVTGQCAGIEAPNG